VRRSSSSARRAIREPVATTLAGLAVGLAIVITAVVAVTPGDAPGRAAARPAPAQPLPSVLPTTAARAPDGGQLRVVEQGFSLAPGPYHDPMLYGITLQNTSRDRIAFATTVGVHLLDPTGKRLKEGSGSDFEVRYTVYAVFPGQRVGLGSDQYMAGRHASALDVTVGTSTWVPVDQPLQRDPLRHTVVRLATVTTSDVSMTRLGPDRALLTFTAISGYDAEMSAAVMVVYRNAAGRVVGGAKTDTPYRCITVPPGRSRPEPLLEIRDVPDGIDVARTEVYLDPFATNLPYGC
jgi:hypothetical protein